MRVILVEDNGPTCRAMKQLLELEGIDVEPAQSVSSARERLRVTSADWLLLDLMLPDGEGELLLGEVRANNLPLRVAVLTGVNDRARLERLQALKPDLVMTKPFDPDALLRAMQAPAGR